MILIKRRGRSRAVFARTGNAVFFTRFSHRFRSSIDNE